MTNFHVNRNLGWLDKKAPIVVTADFEDRQSLTYRYTLEVGQKYG